MGIRPTTHPSLELGEGFHGGRSARNSQLSPKTGFDDLCIALGEPVLGSGARSAQLDSGLDRVGSVRTQLGPRRRPSLPAAGQAVRRAFAHSGHLGSHFMPV